MINFSEFPPPEAFGLPAQFEQWRPHQIETWQAILDAPTRFVGVTAPTGAGKSLMYQAAGAVHGGRRVVVTGGKGLEDQVAGDFKDMGILDIRGQSNYPCKAFSGEWLTLKPEGAADQGCHNGPCHVGLPCTLREAGCAYYDTLRLATQTELVVTNYAYHLSQRKYSDGIGPIQFLTLDEAHVAVDELSNVLKIELPRWLAKTLGIGPPEGEHGIVAWGKWAMWWANTLKEKLDTKASSHSQKDLIHKRRLKQCERILRSLAGMVAGDWIEDHTPEAWVFECLYPHQYAEGLLFQGAKKVVLTSATLTEKTLTMLGIPPGQITMVNCPSHFPVERRPVIWVPTVRMDFRTSPASKQFWANRIDQIVGSRPEVKGIIHTVSFDRAKFLLSECKNKDRMRIPASGAVQETVEQFRKTDEPWVLVSPSIMTGWDFPDDQCRFQIIGKLPFQSTQSQIVKARQEQDKEYGPYMMMQSLVQAVGRGMRSETDWCETLIVDDNWAWVQGKYKKFAPDWFWSATGKSITIPAPLGVKLGVAA